MIGRIPKQMTESDLWIELVMKIFGATTASMWQGLSPWGRQLETYASFQLSNGVVAARY